MFNARNRYKYIRNLFVILCEMLGTEVVVFFLNLDIKLTALDQLS